MSCPNSFDSPFLQRYIYFCIKYLYCSIPPVSGSTTAFTNDPGKGLSSIYVKMLCVTIRIVGAIWFIYCCVTIGTSLGATLGGLPGFIFCVCTLGFGVWCCYFILGYKYITSALTWSSLDYTSFFSQWCTLYILVDCCSIAFVMMLNNYTRLLNAEWWVSLLVANIAFETVFCNDYTKYCVDSISASSYETLGIFTFCGENSTTSAILSDIVSVTNNF